MANKLKIVGIIAEKVLELHSQGKNARQIALVVGMARCTIKKFLRSHDLAPNNRQSVSKAPIYEQFVAEVQSGADWTATRKKFSISYDKAKEVLLAANITPAGRKQAAAKRRLTPAQVTDSFSEQVVYIGYDETENKHVLLDKEGRVFKKSACKISQGVPYGKNGHPLTEQEFAQKLEAIGKRLAPGSFSGVKKPATVYCAAGHRNDYNKASYALRFDCPSCGNSGTSKEELEVLSWVKEFYPSAEKLKLELPDSRYRRKEIDIYIPEIKLGIEYCGTYFHSTLNPNASKDLRHYKKMEIANSLGIRLITMFDYEWKNSNDKVKSFLMSAMGANKTKVYARKCSVEVVDTQIANEFLNRNHLQGASPVSDVFWGLMYQNELIAVMSAGRHPHRPNKDSSETYLTRLAFKSGVTVVGGASKLFAAYKQWATEKGYEAIVSWSDNRWSAGGVYKALGFELKPPTRSNGRKMGLKDGSIWPERHAAYRGELISKSKAKRLLAEDKGVIFFYDCGVKRWVYPLPS